MENTTSTLAETLLDDLDDLSDVEEQQPEDQEQQQEENDAQNSSEDSKPQSQQDSNDNVDPKWNALKSRLLYNASLQAHIQTTQQYEKEQKDKNINNNNNNQDNDTTNSRDYDLIVQSNAWIQKLMQETTRIHHVLVDVYRVKFPELHDLLPAPPEYQQAVQILQNETDVTRVQDELLAAGIPAHQIIPLTVASSTTEGRVLRDDELSYALALCRYLQELRDCQAQMTDFVQGRMGHLAPALSALIGPHVTAQLVGLAGGLHELSLIPACNIQVMGQHQTQHHKRAGFANKTALGDNAAAPHQGILVQSDLFSSSGILPPPLRHKLLKQVAAKAALCARCDAVNAQQGRPRSAAPGLKYRHEIITKLQQWQAPHAAQVQKALPKPDLTVKKRRGGKRIRRMKERFEETALMKQANTRSFSTQAGEYGDDAMGLTLGLLDTQGDGSSGVRKTVGEKKRARVANTKRARKQRALAAKISGQYQEQDAAMSSGMASTVAFTPLQAMELVNPDAQKDRVRQANQKWFADTAGFQSALPKKK